VNNSLKQPGKPLISGLFSNGRRFGLPGVCTLFASN